MNETSPADLNAAIATLADWLVAKFGNSEIRTPLNQYLVVYFLVAGLSLVVDFVDVARHLPGER